MHHVPRHNPRYDNNTMSSNTVLTHPPFPSRSPCPTMPCKKSAQSIPGLVWREAAHIRYGTICLRPQQPPGPTCHSKKKQYLCLSYLGLCTIPVGHVHIFPKRSRFLLVARPSLAVSRHICRPIIYVHHQLHPARSHILYIHYTVTLCTVPFE